MCLILDTSFFSDVEFGVFKVKKNVFQQWVMIAEANLTLSDVYFDCNYKSQDNLSKYIYIFI